MNRFLVIICALSLTLVASAREVSSKVEQGYMFNRAPLAENHFAELPLGAIKPEGWLLDQLHRQRDGMTGHLDELYEKIVGPDNAWIGGEGDTWERGPYWLDGLTPLAYILEDKELISKVNIWVEAMIKSQTEDGYFGNRVSRPYMKGYQRGNAEDWWPKMVALKVLKQHYMATGDERVIRLMTEYFKYQLANLPQYHLDNWTYWGKWRGGDNLEMVYWLYNITGDAFLLELGDLIHSQTTAWTAMFHGETKELQTQNSVHCVNLAHGFKEPVIWWQRSHDDKDLNAPKAAWNTMKHTIGLPTGLWAGDELLQFGDPTRGSELCTAVEMMYSLEEMIQASGDPQWADHLERVAYNALPTQATDAYDARQYYQQTNQIASSREFRPYVTPHNGTDNVFGILSGYPCCTCNMHQGWPKFVQNLWYASKDGGVAAFVYAPSTARVIVGAGASANENSGVEAILHQETLYPFEESVKITVDFAAKKVKKATFPLYLRIPEWCDEAQVLVNGVEVAGSGAEGMVRIEREWAKGDQITLNFPMSVRTSRWYSGSTVVERGPLVYALKMEEKWEKKEFEPEMTDQFGPYYWTVTTDTPWNYAFLLRDCKPELISENFKVELKSKEGQYPWNLENAPVSIKAKAVYLNNWQEYKGSTGPIAYYNEVGGDTGEEVWIELIPYGCTTLRIAEFPTRR
jgi:hypothetical protein